MAPAMKNGRCRMHGGTSTGPRTSDGKARCAAVNWRHGMRSAQVRAQSREFRARIRWRTSVFVALGKADRLFGLLHRIAVSLDLGTADRLDRLCSAALPLFRDQVNLFAGCESGPPRNWKRRRWYRQSLPWLKALEIGARGGEAEAMRLALGIGGLNLPSPQTVEVAVVDENLQQAAKVNSGDKFELIFKNLLQALFIERIDQNEEIFVRYMNNADFREALTSALAREAYRRLRRG